MFTNRNTKNIFMKWQLKMEVEREDITRNTIE